ncbi:hypothetical protein [Psychromonas ossibalaenae]|uniref:hypothetical protein n=1 Tax=Psychromonas ossibalaenae TaxID=444922 RepID=UPI00036EB0F3|nr:hypothetical protein [Psychromonas ossibalaenae]
MNILKAKSAFLRLPLLILISIISFNSFAVNVTTPALRKGSELDKYSSRLIEFLIDKAGDKAVMTPYRSIVNSQSRKVSMLQEGTLSVDWLGASKTMEEKLIPVRFPVFRGLLGHRIFITNTNTGKKLHNVTTKEQLDTFLMIQGEGWADVDVLRSSGFKVKELPSFENIFKVVSAGRADLFPRAVIEPFSEVAERSQLPNLIVDDQLMVVYKFPMFFFVSPKQPELAELLKKGFDKSYNDGSFLEFFENDPLVKKTFAEAKLKQRRIFVIDNPHLSEETRNIDDKYWMKL